MQGQQDWSEWEKERKRFKEQDTEGFTQDLEALEAHIKRLANVAPKDKAGFPVYLALEHISKMQKMYQDVLNYIASCQR